MAKPVDANESGAGATSAEHRPALVFREQLRLDAELSDAWFDRYLLAEQRRASRMFWTPLQVAVRAARWFDEVGVRRVVDVGSGAGKFCVAAALSGTASYVGVEHRTHCVAAARELARLFEVQERVTFLEATLGSSFMPEGDAYYFYNPFGENLFGIEERLDHSVPLSVDRFSNDLRAAVALLEAAPFGTHALTYNGLGDKLPASYVQVREELYFPNELLLWRKQS